MNSRIIVGNGKKHLIFFSLVFFVVLLDQISKYLVRAMDKEIVVNSFFKIAFVKNTGISFGLFHGWNTVFICIAVMFIGGILFYYDKIILRDILIYSFALITAGAIGNLLDRIFLGYVTDFIAFNFFYVFNVADSAITIGAIILIIDSFRKRSVPGKGLL